MPPGTRVEIAQPDGTLWVGTLVPAHELSADRVIQLKLDSGYNIGVRVGPRDALRVLTDARPGPNGNGGTAPPPAPSVPGPLVTLLSTGGTIASRVDYRTGGVRPVQEEAEILAFYPDLARDGPVRVEPVFDRLSEDIAPEDWATLADHVVHAFGQGARGVVIAHGTDTLGFTASALSFLLEDLPGPVVLVGAQRSPDRPSSDGPSNLRAAIQLARSAAAGEVLVVMHAGLSDDRFAVHRGTRVRKMHASRRDAFHSLNVPPLAIIDGTGIHWARPARPPHAGPARVGSRFGPAVGLLWFYPGLPPERAEQFVRDLRAVVLAGTGLGHVSAVHLPWIRSAVARGVVVVMTTQCLEGAVDPYVYATGRELLRAGVVYAADMLPEVAYVKLLWAVGRASSPDEVRALLVADRVGEMGPRREVVPPI